MARNPSQTSPNHRLRREPISRTPQCPFPSGHPRHPQKDHRPPGPIRHRRSHQPSHQQSLGLPNPDAVVRNGVPGPSPRLDFGTTSRPVRHGRLRNRHRRYDYPNHRDQSSRRNHHSRHAARAGNWLELGLLVAIQSRRINQTQAWANE